jgi:hypothetical protein
MSIFLINLAVTKPNIFFLDMHYSIKEDIVGIVFNGKK